MVNYDVYGIGNSIIDILVKVDDSVLDELGLSKGIMQLIDHSTSKRLLGRFDLAGKTVMPGGSCCNTMIGISNMGGRSMYAGTVGKDVLGEIFDDKLREFGVFPHLMQTEGMTGSSVILVTPDSERTMNTHLGVCNLLEKEHIMSEHIKNSKIFHTTAYALDTTPEVVMHALETAKKNSVKVSFDISDPFLVKAQKELLRDVCKEFVDIVFMNKEEARLFTGKSPDDAIQESLKLCDTVALKVGGEGSIVGNSNGIHRIPVFKVNALDTTGAGDMYAAGFLFGLTNGYSLEESGRIASYSASKVVEVMGARIPYKLDVSFALQ